MTLSFQRIALANWRNFKDVDVHVGSRVFLVGPNASGKSNFLDALRFLRDLVLDGGGLARAVESRGGLKKVRSVFARRNPHVRLEVEVTDNTLIGWRYCLEFKSQEKTHAPVVHSERVARLVEGSEQPVLVRPDRNDKQDPARLSQTAIQQVNTNQPFRELAEFFAGILYLHAVPHLIREGQRRPETSIGTDPYGRDLLQAIHRAKGKTKTSRLSRIEGILKVVTPNLQNLELVKDDDGRPHLRVKFVHWRPQGAYQSESELSDGTLRLIGLLWALQERAGPLLLEEPELSLHPAVVRRLAPFIAKAQRTSRGRQVILSTHSVEILQDEGIAPEELLLVQPGDDGSIIVEGAADDEIRRLMQDGLTASDIAIARTAPAKVESLSQMSFDFKD